MGPDPTPPRNPKPDTDPYPMYYCSKCNIKHPTNYKCKK